MIFAGALGRFCNSLTTLHPPHALATFMMIGGTPYVFPPDGRYGMDRDMGTHVRLANMALRIMQGDPIESLDEDSPTARTERMYYFNVYGNCLSQTDWTFATKQERLQELSHPPVGQYKHGYKLPIDTLSIVWIRHGDGDGHVSVTNDVAYEVFSGDVVCSNAAGPLYICPTCGVVAAIFY